MRRGVAERAAELRDVVTPCGAVTDPRPVWVAGCDEEDGLSRDDDIRETRGEDMESRCGGSVETCVGAGTRGKESVAPQKSWLDFGSWLAQHKGERESSNPEGDVGDVGDDDTNEANEANERDAHVQVETGAALPATTSAAMAPKDCRQESNLLTSFGRQGSQEISVILGATGIPASMCPVVPTKMVASVLTALYEPLVKLEVGVLTRAMESPMQLKPREKIGKGTLALYILPDDSLSLTFEAPLDGGSMDVASAQNTKEVMGMVNMNLGLNDVRSANTEEFHGTVWEELARFPRWREHSDLAVVTVHMLKGDKTGRSFYVLAGDDTAPPQFSLSSDSRRKFDDFSSMASNVCTNSDSAAKNRRHYFWMMGENLEESIHALGKIKSYIKRPPTLSKISGVPENVLDSVTDWAMRVEEMQREREHTDGSGPAMANPISNLGAVLSRRTPHMAINQSICDAGTAGDSNNDRDRDNAAQTISIRSDVSVTANASAVFKDNRFNISCPCCLTVTWNVKSRVNVVLPEAAGGDPNTSLGGTRTTGDAFSVRDNVANSIRDLHTEVGKGSPFEVSSRAAKEDTQERITQHKEDQILKIAAMIATAEARCTSEILARMAVEAIGKVRIEEWICEDFVRNTRQHRARAKAERQRKKDLQRGYAALEAAKPLIQRAVAKLVDADGTSKTRGGHDADSASGRIDDEIRDDSTASPPAFGQPVVEPVVEPTSVAGDDVGKGTGVAARGKKISINDLSKLF